MNFDEFRNNYRNIKCDNDQVVPDEFKKRVETVVDKIKRENRRDKIILLTVIIFFFLMIIIYLSKGISDYIESPNSQSWLGDIVYSLAMLSAIPVLLYKYIKIHRTKFDRPVLDFIKQVEKDYALFKKSSLLIIPFIVLSGISTIFILYPDRQPTVTEILIGLTPIAAGLVIGFSIGVLMWVNKKLPILDEIRQIKESLEK